MSPCCVYVLEKEVMILDRYVRVKRDKMYDIDDDDDMPAFLLPLAIRHK